jgi:hypothetical protein
MKIIQSLFIILLTQQIFGQENDTTSINKIVINVDEFSYSIKVPEDWVADTSVSNGTFTNITLYERTPDPFYEKPVIQVYAFKKENATLREDLNSDIMNFREEYKKKEEEEDFTISCGGFTCYNKLLFVKDSVYQYVIYADPGKKYKSAISVSMNTSKRKATDSQLKALRKVVASIKMLKG